MKLLAYITKGLKGIAQDEIEEKISESRMEEKTEKYISFTCSKESLAEVLKLRTVDDVHILLKVKDFSSRPGTEETVDEFPLEELEESKNLVESFRDTGESFSLTISRYRNRKADAEEIEAILENDIAERTGMKFSKRGGSDFDVRVHLEEKRVLYSVRVDERPLYFRGYWKQGREGSLRTSVAAALCRVAELEEGERVVDNFCGAGTILCEAAECGAEVHGGDIDREAVKYSRENLRQVSAEASNRVKNLDAKSTGQPENYFDVAVSNLPWGKQVDLNAVELYSESIEEYSRVLREEGRIVILGNHPEIAEKYVRKYFPNHNIERFELGFLGQNPTVIDARPGR